MASQDSLKLLTSKTAIKDGRLVVEFVIKQRSPQKESNTSSSSVQPVNGDKSRSCIETHDSSFETMALQENSNSNSKMTALKSEKDGFTIIKWERLTKTYSDDHKCVNKDNVISNTIAEKLPNENVNSEKEISNSNTTDPEKFHPIKYEFIPMDRRSVCHKTVESAMPSLAFRKQPVVVLERIKVEPDLLVSKIPEELGKNMQEGCSKNLGNMSLSQDSVAGTLLDKKTEECSIECSEQEVFLRSVTMPCTITDTPQETSQSEDGILARKVKNEDNGTSKEMEEEIQSVIQANIEEMLISEQISKGEGFTYNFPFACGQCNYTAKLQHHLKNHMKTHMSDRPFMCEICGKGFKHAHHLSGHKRTHSSERPYSCEDCGRGFNQISNLLRHRRTHLGVTERDQHKCYKCGKSFFTAYSLRRHSEMHENLKKKVKTMKDIKKRKLTYNPTMDDHKRKFECDVCGRKFIRKEHVMRHMLTHTGESMYTCEVCGKGYGSKKALEKHLNIHTGDDIKVEEEGAGSSSSSNSSGEDDMEDC